MTRSFAVAALLAASAAAQLNITQVSQFTNAVFAGNGTIGVCTDSFSGDIWVIDFSNTINLHRFDVAGNLLSSHATNTCTPAMTSPNDITQDRTTGDLWLVDNDTPGKILRFSTTGACLTGGFTLGSAYLNPVAIVHHPVLNTFFIGINGAVVQWTTTGTNLGQAFAVFGGAICSGITYVPATGNFLASQSSTNVITELSPTGLVVSTTPLAGVTNIQGLDYDPNSGLITVADNTNVTIHVYSYIPAAPAYQIDQAAASLRVNGVLGSATHPATINLGLNQSASVTFSSITPGSLWELAIGSAPLVPAGQGGIVLSDGQILNVDITDPALLLLWSFFQSPPFQGFTGSISSPVPVALSAQLALVDGSTPSGLRLSQPVRIVIQ